MKLLDDLSKHSVIFVDANIFIYLILGDPRYKMSCKKFLNRIKDNEIKAFTSVIVLSEILHKLMISEIVKKYNVGYLEALNYFKNKPNIFLKLEKCWEDIKEIKSINNLVILDVTDKVFDIGIKYSKEFKLLISDALHLAVMKQNNITNLASNDSDFERVGWINLCKPKEER